METATKPAPAKTPRTFRQRMHAAREDAIVEAVTQLLAEKGFESMTLDEVAAQVGIAKASLYKHFPSKEDLAAEAMARLMGNAQRYLAKVAEQDMSPIDRLKAVTRWTMSLQLAGEMPKLPSENSTLRATLVGHKVYMNGLLEVSDQLGEWIEAAQADGSLNATLPPVAVLYTLYARACDPVLGFLRLTEQYSDEQIIDMVMSTCFDGLRQR
ncbi:helix-turn-helix domain-containing protein [Hydrogenophaga sp. 5NK40-0174]|uniref:TetR/AcrR family transcriptional regulator n=1 Tax=Hydrogenophaga sp. 5NK40-0174 TaxID=3127649 RepID=UPI003103E4C1